MSAPDVGSAFLNNAGNFLAIFTAVFAICYYAMRKTPSGGLPPSLRSIPFVGSIPFLPSYKTLPKYFLETSMKLGPIFSFYGGSRYIVVLNTREVVEEALVKQGTVYSGRAFGMAYLFMNPELRGLFMSQYTEKFRKYHHLSLQILKDMGFGRQSIEETIIDETERLVERIRGQNAQPFDPAGVLVNYSLNIISAILFGDQTEHPHEELEKVAKLSDDLARNPKMALEVCPALVNLRFYKAALERAKEDFRERSILIDRRTERSLGSSGNSFVKEFVQREGADYDHKELHAILLDLISATEATPSTFLWAVVLMANYQEIQHRIRLELQTVVAEGRLPSLDDVTKLPYVEAAILELMRLKTVTPLSVPRMTTRDTHLGGYFVSKGTTIIPNLYALHHDPRVWSNPNDYSPERFLDKDGKVLGKDRIIPFSIGKRACLGEVFARQEVFLLFTSLILKFKIMPEEGQDRIKYDEVLSLILSPSSFKCRFIQI